MFFFTSFSLGRHLNVAQDMTANQNRAHFLTTCLILRNNERRENEPWRFAGHKNHSSVISRLQGEELKLEMWNMGSFKDFTGR